MGSKNNSLPNESTVEWKISLLFNKIYFGDNFDLM